MSKEYIHTPRLLFVNDDRQVIGFCRVTGHSDEVFSRRNQTDAIRAYAAGRGMSEPSVLPTAAWEALLRAVIPGAILIVPDVRSLLRKPSDFAQLMKWVNEYQVRIHCLELGGEISGSLALMRLVSEAYEHVEAESVELRKQLRATEQSIDDAITEVLASALPAITQKVFNSIKDDAALMVSGIHTSFAAKSELTRLRMKQAAELVAAQGVRTPVSWKSTKTAELLETERAERESAELLAQHDQDAKGFTMTKADWEARENGLKDAQETAREIRRQDRSRYLPSRNAPVSAEGWADIKAS